MDIWKIKGINGIAFEKPIYVFLSTIDEIFLFFKRSTRQKFFQFFTEKTRYTKKYQAAKRNERKMGFFLIGSLPRTKRILKEIKKTNRRGDKK